MALTNTDLLLVQRGATPLKMEASVLATYVKDEVDSADIEIASAAQLGVIRVGNNLSIDPATGVLDAVIPAGTEFQGVWVDAANPPTTGNGGKPLATGMFWIWDNGSATLNNPLWGSANNEAVNDGDLIFYDGTTFDVVPGTGGGGSAVTITGTLPITVDDSNPSNAIIGINKVTDTTDGSMTHQDKVKLDSISAGAEANVAQNLGYTPAANSGKVDIDQGGLGATIPAATAGQAGLMTGADKAALDLLAAAPTGILSVVEGDGINVDTTNATNPVISVEFGASPNGTPKLVMPYDLTTLGELT